MAQTLGLGVISSAGEEVWIPLTGLDWRTFSQAKEQQGWKSRPGGSTNVLAHRTSRRAGLGRRRG